MSTSSYTPSIALSPCPTVVDLSINPSSADGEQQLKAVGSDSDLKKQATLPPSSASSGQRAPKREISTTRKALLLMVFCMAQFLDAFNNSSLFPPLPTIGKTFDMSEAEQQWMFSAYALTFSSFLLLSGRISDISSPKWTFITGLSIVSVMSLILGFLPNKIALIVVRALQGIGAALTIPSSLSLLVWTFPDPKSQSRAIATFSGMSAIGIVLGLLIGAAFTTQVSWQWCFWFVTCIGVPTLLASLFLIPGGIRNETDSIQGGEDASSVEAATASKKTSRGGVDFIGVSFLTSAMILFVFGLTSGPTAGWGTAQVWAPFVLSLVLLAGFLYWETRMPESDAALPPSMWFYPNFGVLFGLAILPFGWWIANFLSFTELWQSSYGLSSLETAVRFLPLVIPTGIVITLLAVFPPTNDPKRAIMVGFVLMIVSTAILPFARGLENYWRLLFPAWILGSTGDALLIVYCSVALFRTTPENRSGLTGSVLNSGLQLGVVISTAAVTGITSSVNARMPGDAFNGVSASFWFIFGWTVLEAVMVTVLYREKKEGRVQADVEQGMATPTAVATPVEKDVITSV
ncbi:MFS general substrate transporter [Calocera viscosa TUFC12733]|uniref:MFS general substrate transporter n=1 Tax=Calocera viscosa (strain TUFC12733) TaxID=1330018 RepID=A0A167IYF4_CALVF|nr:MFS general substrate transporter [Calocera viscosa TUFC12733]